MQKTFTVVAHRTDHRGGMERYAVDIANFLHKNGRLASLLTKHASKTSSLDKAIVVKSLGLRWLPAKLQTLLFSGYCWLYKKRHPETVLFCCSRILFPDIIACGGTHKGYLRALNKLPTLSDRLEIFFETQAYQNATLVIAHSTNMQRELLEDYQIPASKIITLCPPVNQTHFQIAKKVQSRAFFFSRMNINVEGKVIFLFPSSGHKRKGLDDIIKAISPFKQHALLLIAGKKITRQQHIISLGYVSDMPTLYAACDYTILASYHEPFGLVAIESVLCGTPVLLSDQCGCNAVLTNQVKMNFSAGNIEELTSVIATAISNPIKVDETEKFVLYNFDIQHHIKMIDNRLT